MIKTIKLIERSNSPYFFSIFDMEEILKKVTEEDVLDFHGIESTTWQILRLVKHAKVQVINMGEKVRNDWMLIQSEQGMSIAEMLGFLNLD